MDALQPVPGLPGYRTLVPESGHERRRVQEYCRSQLGPTLRSGDSIICDNLPPHKVADVKELIEARGAAIKVLPPCRPIEQVFVMLKALLRKAVDRNNDMLWQGYKPDHGSVPQRRLPELF